MNKGKICVSVCATTADDLIERAKRAAETADVVELRFDCLNPQEFDPLDQEKLNRVLRKVFKIDYRKPLLSTFRAAEQGGVRPLSSDERAAFWNSGFDYFWADSEEDQIENSWNWQWTKRICSHHDFKGTPANIEAIYERLKAFDADAVKIAVRADDIGDALTVWKLLERAARENVNLIPIAMGEAGKWTRILGLAHGASMTYAALETGAETASGQISVEDLIETYRVRELDRQTEIYGILGAPVAHSLSPYIHNAAFRFHRRNAVFIPFETKNLDEFIGRFVRPATREIALNFRGFAVTAPHKQAIIKHLDGIDETARTIGAVNTLKIVDGKIYGSNTDAEGFITPLKNAYGDLKDVRVAVLGGGGAARAAIYALQNEQARVTVFARNLEKVEELKRDFQVEISKLDDANPDFTAQKIFVNTTPLGTVGALENETPLGAETLRAAHLAYDLVYNPFETRFMREAKTADVPTVGGLAMLIAQAMAQSKIWTGSDAPMQEMSRAALRRLR